MSGHQLSGQTVVAIGGSSRIGLEPARRVRSEAPARVKLIPPGFVDTPLSASLLGDQLDAGRQQLVET